MTVEPNSPNFLERPAEAVGEIKKYLQEYNYNIRLGSEWLWVKGTDLTFYYYVSTGQIVYIRYTDPTNGKHWMVLEGSWKRVTPGSTNDEQLAQARYRHQQELNAVYYDRNLLAQLVAKLARQLGYDAHLSMDEKEGPEWPVLLIELPLVGQISYHLPYKELKGWYSHTGSEWDGHTTAEKQERIKNYLSHDNGDGLNATLDEEPDNFFTEFKTTDVVHEAGVTHRIKHPKMMFEHTVGYVAYHHEYGYGLLAFCPKGTCNKSAHKQGAHHNLDKVFLPLGKSSGHIIKAWEDLGLITKVEKAERAEEEFE